MKSINSLDRCDEGLGRLGNRDLYLGDDNPFVGFELLNLWRGSRRLFDFRSGGGKRLRFLCYWYSLRSGRGLRGFCSDRNQRC